MYGIISTIANIASSIPIMINGNLYKKFFRDLGNYRDFGRPKNGEYRIKYVQFIFRWYYIICVILSFQFLLVGMFSSSCIDKKHEYNLKIVCGVGLDVYYPFTIELGPLKYFLEFAGTCIVTMVYSVGYMYCASFMAVSELLIIKIEHLTTMVHQIGASNKPKLTTKKLETCVKYHVHVTEYVADLKN